MATVPILLRHFKGPIVRISSFRRAPIYPFVETLSLSNTYRWNTSNSSFKGNQVSASQNPDIDKGSSFDSALPRKLFIGNLRSGKDSVDKQTLRAYFSQYGEIEDLKVLHYARSGIPMGYAFLTFKDVEVANKVLTVPHFIGSKEIDVKPAKPRSNPGLFLKRKRNMTVIVTNVLHDTHKDRVKEHFSQFGNVEDVMVANKGDREDDYYVVFSTLDGAKRSLEKPTQKIAGQSVDSEVKEFNTLEGMLSKSKVIEVTSEAESTKLTVEALKEYFKSFGEIEVINLVVKPVINLILKENLTIAFVSFTDHVAVADILLHTIHTVDGVTVKVRRAKNPSLAELNHLQKRSLQIAVEGLPQSALYDDFMRFFERTFGIIPGQVYFQRANASAGTKWCIATFRSENELEHVLKEPNQTFDGFRVCLRRLGWVR